jgi:alpha-1,3-rhamnosyl/mannosyltransferase
MRVALDGQPLLAPLAGVGHYTRQLVLALARLGTGDRYYVLAPYPLRIVRRRATRLRGFAEPNVELRVPGWWATARARLQRRLGGEAALDHGIAPAPDVFHATNNIFPYRVRATGQVLTIHDLTLLLFPEWHPADRLARMVPEFEPAVARANVIITPSCSTRNDVLERLPVDPERVRVVPHGVDAAFTPRPAAEVAAALAPLGLRGGGYLLFVGTIEPRKNLLRLLQAMDLVDPAVGPLVLAGGRGWNDGPIRVALERLERAGRVRSLGYVADELRPALLTGARAFVYPSLYEGFGWPPLEAMACGTPVVTSNVSSLPEVVGDAALFVSPDDVDGLAAALHRVWHDEALRADLRARGIARAREFSWERTARMTLDAYRAALSAR